MKREKLVGQLLLLLFAHGSFVLFGYQYKEAEFRDGDLTTDFSFQGPMAGFNFRF